MFEYPAPCARNQQARHRRRRRRVAGPARRVPRRLTASLSRLE